jgi:hypothetical protein
MRVFWAMLEAPVDEFVATVGVVDGIGGNRPCAPSTVKGI